MATQNVFIYTSRREEREERGEAERQREELPTPKRREKSEQQGSIKHAVPPLKTNKTPK
jgi:hypothetical protein